MVHVTTSASATEVFAGIDWGGSFHQICLIDEHGQVLRQQRVQHNAAGLDELDRLLAGRQAQLRVAIERAEGLLVEHLHTLGSTSSASPRRSPPAPGSDTGWPQRSPTRSTRSSWPTRCATNIVIGGH